MKKTILKERCIMKRYDLGMGFWIELNTEDSTKLTRWIAIRAIRQGRFEGSASTSDGGKLKINKIQMTKFEMILLVVFHGEKSIDLRV
jgi:hypothetical protein